MSWWERFQQLRRRGVLGMNRRNTECILDLNPRRLFPRVDSKLKMRDLCRGIGVPTPDVYAVVAAHSVLRQLPRLLGRRTDFVVKPNRGAGGRGVLVVTGKEGSDFLRHDGSRMAWGDLRQHVSNVISGLYSLGSQPDQALIQQRVQLHPEFEPISYQGIGDVRVILYKFVPAMAMLRLPTRQSGGRANLHQGGIGAGVDLTTGVTHHAVLRNRLATRHPDTGASVLGFRVPYWPEILEMSRKAARAVGMGYLGVDIVVDRQRGPLLLEANARPGLAIQIANGRGLLARFEEIDRMSAEKREEVQEEVGVFAGLRGPS
jgi:alpha-L-glutamate ligase-like protein